MDADAVAPCVTRSSTFMILCNTDRSFHGKGFQQSVSISGGRKISIVNTCVCFSWKKKPPKHSGSNPSHWFISLSVCDNHIYILYFHSRCHFSQWTHDAITALLCQNDVAPSFWRHNDVAIASWVRRVFTVAMVSIHKMRSYNTLFNLLCTYFGSWGTIAAVVSSQ